MPLYAVLTDTEHADLNTKIAEQFPADHIKITPTQWLVNAEVIPNQLGDQLGVRTGAFGRVLILEITGGAAGWQLPGVWGWLKLKAPKT